MEQMQPPWTPARESLLPQASSPPPSPPQCPTKSIDPHPTQPNRGSKHEPYHHVRRPHRPQRRLLRPSSSPAQARSRPCALRQKSILPPERRLPVPPLRCLLPPRRRSAPHYRGAGPPAGSGQRRRVASTAEASDSPPADGAPAKPVVLLTCAGGIRSAGLAALVDALVAGGRCDVHVCASESDKPTCGHSITIRETITATSVDFTGAKAFEISGTPVDCVSLALSGRLFPWSAPALVISGINAGPNCGYEMFHSSAIAAAREALVYGVPSIAISLNWKKDESKDSDFKDAAQACLPLINAALAEIEKGTFLKGCLLNIGIPSAPSANKMARSRLTARKSTGGRLPSGQLAPRYPVVPEEAQQEEAQQEVGDYPVQLQPGAVEQGYQAVQHQENDEEDPEERVFEEDGTEEHPQLYDGVFLEVNEDGDIIFPPEVEAEPEPDVAGGEELDQNAAGNDPDDSGDNPSSSEESSSEEDDESEEEEEEVDIEGLEDDNSAVGNGEDNNGDQNENNNNNENEEQQGDAHRYHRAEYHEHTYLGPDAPFCELLEELLQEIEYAVRPLYITRHYVEPGMRDYYTTEVHVRVATAQAGRWRTRTIHPCTAHFASEAAAINDAARRALWSISNTFRDRLEGTDFRFVPSRVSGTENTVIPMGDFRDSRVDILARVTAALNTDLEGATAELDRTHQELQNAQARIAQLEAQLAGQQPPDEAEASCPSRSPPRKRLRYGTPAATTSLQWNRN